LPSFFIRHPTIAIVLALLITLGGVVAGVGLPVAQYPQITLPTIHIAGTYPGADASATEQSLAEPIEKAVNGVDGMAYLESRSSGSGQYSADVTFGLGKNADTAAVQVQNRVAQTSASLPPEAVQVGVTTQKSSPDTLMYLAFESPKGTYDQLFLDNYVSLYVVDALKRVKGVGNVTVFGSDFGMRIWLQPDRLSQLGLTPTDVIAAIREQNAQAPAGSIGQYPAPSSQQFQYSVTVKGRLSSAREFGDIIIRAQPDGSMIRVRDVARVALGSLNYNVNSQMNGRPVSAIAISLTPDASAMETAKLIHAKLEQLSKSFPDDFAYDVVVDNTTFIKASLEEVVITLGLALVIVMAVVALFLQNWRAVLIPMLAVPVSLVGAFIAFAALGFTLNTLTLFAMVLAIGIVVDDAIVVVEAVSQHMAADGSSAKEATERAMREVTGPVVAVAGVLAAVFVPCAFLGGISGAMFRQFALTIAVSTLLSALVALTLTPALCATLLKPEPPPRDRGPVGRFFDRFNRLFDTLTHRYSAGVRAAIRRAGIAVFVLASLSTLAFFLMAKLPGEFVPQEDQGYFIGTIQLPEAASLNRTMALSGRFTDRIRHLPGVHSVLVINGYDILSTSSKPNAALFVVALQPWDERKHPPKNLRSLIMATFRTATTEPGARILAFNPPPIPGVGSVGGLAFRLQQRDAGTPAELAAVAQTFVAAARQRSELTSVFSQFNPDTPSFELDLDRARAKQLGVPISDISAALQAYLGGLQVNDFNAFGGTYKVVVQADPAFRTDIGKLSLFSVRSANGAMVPLSTLVTPRASNAPTTITRYNLSRTASINATPAQGFSSGQGMAAMEEVAARVLPAGYGYEWTGLSLQEKNSSGQILVVFGLALVVVFLLLTALYESWTIPFAVILAVPLGVLGAAVGLSAVHLSNNLYAQIGLILLIGMVAKNAILIVEFAKLKREEGATPESAALEAAHLRLRPIIMTSLAFIFGVAPLIFASGAGAASRVSMGITVCIGMLFGTALAIFIVPVLYVLLERAQHAGGLPAMRLFSRFRRPRPVEAAHDE
jgi:hydrophobe/amphiphile efflux-1 (HAE1) family protein